MTDQNEQKQLVLFGAGRIGSVHFMNTLTNPRACIRWIVEVDTLRASNLTNKYGMSSQVSIHHMDDAAKVLADSKVDGVLICTNHDTHAPIIKMALSAGKPVFCEKPLSLEFQDIKQCYNMAEAKNLPLMCAFNRRFDPHFAFVKNKLVEDSIGKVRSVYVISRDPKSMMEETYLKVSGGIFKDSVVHNIDMANYLVGEFPKTVYATGHAHHDMYKRHSDIDTAIVIMKYPGGAVATLELSRWGEINHDQRVEVHGMNGMLQAQNPRPVEGLLWNTDGTLRQPIYESLERHYEAYKQEVEHYIDVLQGKEKLSISAESVLASFIIATACKISLDQEKVVHLKQYATETYNYEY